MQMLHQRWLLIGLSTLFLLVSLGLVIRTRTGPARHTKIREAFILLANGGYTNDAAVLYNCLLFDLRQLPEASLIDDWQRTALVVDPQTNLPGNLIWRYQSAVRLEMEKRAETAMPQARQLAAELRDEWAGAEKVVERTNLPSTNQSPPATPPP